MYDELYAKIDAMFVLLTREGYQGHGDEVLSLIHECRARLQAHLGNLGPWETEDLNQAEAWARVGRLKLAVNLAEGALDVTRLPGEEYQAGYNYARNRS